jgi:hypothetical protein
MHVFETPGKVALRINASGGRVDVRADDVQQTTVDVEALRDDDASREAAAMTTVELRDRGDGHEVVVEVPKHKSGLLGALGRGPKVGIDVRCPLGADLRVATSSADVETEGRLGSVEAGTASGDLSFDVVDGGLKATTASGDVSVREIGGAGSVKTASGDASIGNARGPLNVNLVSGDLELGEAHDSLSAATVSGDQEIDAVHTGEVRLQSVSGDIRVGVASGLRVWIDASAVSGSMRSELDSDDGLGEGDGPVVELRVRTVSGDVQIVRAARVG